MLSIRSLLCASLLACATSTAVAAPGNGIYIGAGVAQARYGIDLGHQVAYAYALTPFTVSGAGLDGSTDTAYRLFAGYQFSHYFALEAGWQDLGSVNGNYTLTNTVTGSAMSRSDKWELSGFNVSLVGQYPFADRFAVLGKVGAFYSKLGYSETSTDSDGSSTFTASDDKGTRLTWGIGGSYRFTDQLLGRLDWDRIESVGSTFTLDGSGNGEFNHIDVWSANLVWEF